MKITQQLHDLGQRLWLDNITRELVKLGTLQSNISECSVTRLTSSHAIFHKALNNFSVYDDAS